jgi:histidine ammonia-lyase
MEAQESIVAIRSAAVVGMQKTGAALKNGTSLIAGRRGHERNGTARLVDRKIIIGALVHFKYSAWANAVENALCAGGKAPKGCKTGKNVFHRFIFYFIIRVLP